MKVTPKLILYKSGGVSGQYKKFESKYKGV